MNLRFYFICIWLFLLQNEFLVTAKRIRDIIYEPINGASCFRRLNGTHQTGCSSLQSGSVGVLHLIQIQEDFDFLLQNGTAPPYAPMVPPHLFTRKNILRLRDEGGKNISVILLINRTNRMTQFSQELNCPNQYSGVMMKNSTESVTCNAREPTKSWNPWGTGLLHEDFPFPIFYIGDSDEIDKLVNCFEKFNNFDYASQGMRSLCAIEVNTFMSAAVDSEVCIRRSNFINNLGQTKYCDPLEGRNVYATLFPREQVSIEMYDERIINPAEKLILVSCRLDTTSMFDGVGLGALDSLMGYAVLVNIAHMLAKILPPNKKPQNKNMNILFVVFNGESYDYIGSQRFVYDLENLAFPTVSTHTGPISFENIEFMLDIGVIDDILSNIKVHSLREFAQATEFTKKLQNYATNSIYDFNITFRNEFGFSMPPTSAQSFLRRNFSFPAVVLNSNPGNQYYHSIYDDVENIRFLYGNTSLDFSELMETSEAFQYFKPDSVQMKIRNISSVIAMALYETLTGNAYSSTKIVNPLLTDEFLFCFLQSAECPLFKAASPPDSLTGLPQPPQRYISVSAGSQEASGWTYRLLGYVLSEKHSNISKYGCNYLPYQWFAGFDGSGECGITTQNYSYALSPAFLIDGYDWKSGQYSTWTESTWSQFSARIFLKPSKVHEIVTLSVGIIMLVISFLLVYIINHRSDVLFETAVPSSTDALTAPTAC